MLTAIVVTAALVTGKDIEWDEMNTKGLYASGALLGLIFTEQCLRRGTRQRCDRVQPTRHPRTDSPGGSPTGGGATYVGSPAVGEAAQFVTRPERVCVCQPAT